MENDVLDCFSIPQLEQLKERYLSRNDAAKAQIVNQAISRKGAVQTEELSNSGKLYPVEYPRDATGRVVTGWTGDNAAWMKTFMGTGVCGRIDHGMAQQAAARQISGDK